MYNFFFVPLRCGFFPFDASPVILVLDYFGDALLLVDIYVLLQTAAHERGTWITDVDQLWSYHFHSPWFILDVLGSIPALDFVMLRIGMNATLRLPRLLRIFSFFRPDHTRVSTSEHLRRMFEMIATLLLTIHLVACAYYSFTIFEGFSPVLPEGAESLWLPDASFQFASVTLQYFRALFFAISHLTAYGRIIYPNSDAQCAFAILVMIFGKFFTAYLVGAVAGIMTQLGVQKTRFGSMMHQIGEFSEQVFCCFLTAFEFNCSFFFFLLQYRLPSELRGRINHYFEHSWNLQQGVDPNQALRYLPVELRSVITLQLVGNMLRSLPMFAACRDTFIKVLAGELAFEAYPAGEFIFYKGEVGSKMYFVVHGRVGLILNPEQSLDPFKVIGRGSFFGEAALFLGKRGASARANTSLQVCKSSFRLLVVDFIYLCFLYCLLFQVLTLSNAALKRVITMFPEFEEMIKKVVNSRAQLMAQKEEIARSESKKAASAQNTTANGEDSHQPVASTVPLDSTERQATVRFDADVPKSNDISP
jgi:CRP-like cAMP-binding protein